jgi:GT2 family glycosyltransferase
MPDASTPETKPQPRVTALVVSYNHVEALRQCLAALEKSKDREALEIIVVDKGSRDGSATIDSEFPHVTMLRLPRNFGNAKALNIGMRTAAGELIFFLVPEVEVHPDTIAQLANLLDPDADAVAVCPVIHEDQFYRLPTPDRGAVMEPMRIAGDVVPVEAATFDAMMARKYFVRGINFLDEKYGEYWADVDLCFQIRRSGKKVLALPSVTCGYTAHADRFPANARKLLDADTVTGGARYFGKYFGFFSGLLFRVKEALKALFSFNLGLFVAILSGRKVDGTQSEL